MTYLFKHIVLRLKLFTLSPLGPMLLGLILFIACQILSDSIILCDGETLDQLQNNLAIEINKYKDAFSSYEYYRDSLKAAYKDPESKLPLWEFLGDQSRDNLEASLKILKNIRAIERAIKGIDPNFKNFFEKQPSENLIIQYVYYKVS